MESEWFNETLTNGSLPNSETGNSTIKEILKNGNPEENSIDWAAEKRAIYITGTVIHCVFLALGLFGNILTIVVLFYKKWSNIVSRHVLLALAVSDTVMLLTHTLNQDFAQHLFQLDLRAFSDVGCKIFYVGYRTAKMTSSWFVVFLCVERFVAVTFPLKAKSIITERLTKMYIFITYLLMACFSIIQSFSTTVEKEKCKKDFFASAEKATFQALALIEMFLFTVIPVGIMVVLTPAIIFNLVKHYKKKRALSNNPSADNAQTKRQLQDLIRTTGILTTVVVTFIVCLTPITIYQQVKFWRNIKNREIETVFALYVFREISRKFEQVNYSINFFLYILSSPTFRKSVFELLHLTKQRPSDRSVTKPENSTVTHIAMPETSIKQMTPGLTKHFKEKDDKDAGFGHVALDTCYQP